MFDETPEIHHSVFDFKTLFYYVQNKQDGTCV